MQAPMPDADEVRDNTAFDALMWAMARPGTRHDLPTGMSDLVLALVDAECRVMTDDPALAQLASGNGAALVGADAADHAFLSGSEAAMATLAALPAGSALHPDQGATMVLSAQIGRGVRLRLTGPGIDGAAELQLGGLPDGFFALRATRCRYPEGVDIVFVGGRQLTALPRSTAVEVL